MDYVIASLLLLVAVKWFEILIKLQHNEPFPAAFMGGVVFFFVTAFGGETTAYMCVTALAAVLLVWRMVQYLSNWYWAHENECERLHRLDEAARKAKR